MHLGELGERVVDVAGEDVKAERIRKPRPAPGGTHGSLGTGGISGGSRSDREPILATSRRRDRSAAIRAAPIAEPHCPAVSTQGRSAAFGRALVGEMPGSAIGLDVDHGRS